MPTVWSPLNVLAFLPALIVSGFVGEAALVAPIILFVALFVLWCPNVWGGQAVVPRRSIVLTGIAVLLSAANIVLAREYGIAYQGIAYVRFVSAISVIWWALLLGVAILALRTPSIRRNLWFHIALFSWLGWYALPYMGELP